MSADCFDEIPQTRRGTLDSRADVQAIVLLDSSEAIKHVINRDARIDGRRLPTRLPFLQRLFVCCKHSFPVCASCVPQVIACCVSLSDHCFARSLSLSLSLFLSCFLGRKKCKGVYTVGETSYENALPVSCVGSFD